MKLRNKKTGEIVEVNTLGLVFNRHNQQFDLGKYASIKELTEKWEDYEPTEPLIKDPKIRKAVRAWAEANEVAKVYVYGIGDGKEYLELYEQDNGMSRISIKTQDGIWFGKVYTVTELCGEEE